MQRSSLPHEPLREWSTAIDEVTRALDSLSTSLQGDEDFHVLLEQVCEQVTRAMPSVDAATITLVEGGKAYTETTTSEVAVALDRAQYESGAGPCLTAAESQVVVRAAIDEATVRWPEFADRSRRVGMGSFLSAPLTLGEDHAGSINCYSANEHGFAEIDERLLDLYTAAVEAALRAHRRYLDTRRSAEQLRSALTSRSVIDQAKGMLMAIRRITADEAFHLLAEESQRDNVKLRVVAERLVAKLSSPEN